ncbi:MAG: hypothetical protein MUC43_13675 [Pirellula sp.]|jgi:hypothetical protein|nr:hypothetical protein [Pirellula sp.]
MGVIPSWIRFVAVFLVVLSTLSPRFFSQSVACEPAAPECKWEENSKEKPECEFGSEEHFLRGSATFGAWLLVANELDRVSYDSRLANPWTVLLRELPARAPPTILS